MSRSIIHDVGAITLEITECVNCGAPFAFSKMIMDRQRESGGGHWCPLCGNNQGWGGSFRNELATTKAELAKAEERAQRARRDAEYFKEQRDAVERSKNAYKGQVTKIKARVGRGMCPCCNRFFENLHRHMETKHPEFKEPEAE